MGAIFIYRNNADVDTDSVLNIFSEKGFDEPERIQWNDYKIILYKKIHKGENNYICDENGGLIVVGTIVYKGNNYTDSLNELYSDLNNNSFDIDELLGSFFLLLKKEDKLSFLTDRANIQNIFYNSQKSIISSSFLAVANSCRDGLTINKCAATEILSTGTLIGPDTFFNDIKRFEGGTKFEGIDEIANLSRKIPPKCDEKYEVCLKEQINVLNRYFKSIKKLADNEGVDSGITGGHDSRLIMALALENEFNISFNTHYRHNKNIEFETAKKVCTKTGSDLKILPVKNPGDMTADELDENFNKAYLFFDGLVRMHSFWTEEYNTMKYRKEILGEKNLGLSGIGGEQYRNEERFNRSSWNLYNTVKYKIILNTCGNCFNDGKAFDETVKYIERKIRKKLSLGDKNRINRLEYKRYLNEVFIPGRLGARNNAENQLSFFLSPFTDYTVSNEAYKIVYNLGSSLQFEEDMIKEINPEIASAPSDHGFNFYEGEPLKNKIKSFLIDFLPDSLLHRYYSTKTSGRDVSLLYKEMILKSKILKIGVEKLELLKLPLDLDKLAKKPDHMPLILALGFLIKKLEGKIRLN